MHDLKTQLGVYLDHVVERLDIDDVLEQKDHAQRVRPVQPRTSPKGRHRWLYAAAVFVVAVVLIGALVVLQTGFVVASPEAVAESFMEAWVEGDGEAVVAKFSADGTFDDGVIDLEEIPGLHDWYRAGGWEFHNEGCQLTSPEGPVISCAYAFENELTRAYGYTTGRPDESEPVRGTFALVIDGAEIKSLRDQFNFDAYNDIWETFAGWVQSKYPDDFDRMYNADASYPLLDPTSIGLWQQRTDEFVANHYSIRTGGDICSAAQVRLIAELQAAGVKRELEPPGKREAASEEEAARMRQGSMTIGDLAIWSEAAARITEETLAELRALPLSEMLYFGIEQQIDWLRQLEAAASAGDTERAQMLLSGEDVWNLDHLVILQWGCPVGVVGERPPATVLE